MDIQYDRISAYVTGRIALVEMEDGLMEHIHTGGDYISVSAEVFQTLESIGDGLYKIGHYQIVVIRYHFRDEAYLCKVGDYV